MAKAVDVAQYILKKAGAMSAMKLQKLTYYSQAWHLVWCERKLFRARIEAWANGPVVPSLYELHRGKFVVDKNDFHGDASALDAEEKETINLVLKSYGDKSPQWLSNLTHMERPWLAARAGAAPGERGNVEILASDMAEYYAAL